MGPWSGLDLTSESVERVRARLELRGLPYEALRQGSALKIPWQDDTFDIVFSHGVLHHIPDIRAAQAEIHRVLKPGGRLIAMLYARHSLNYQVSIRVVRRAMLAAAYPLRRTRWLRGAPTLLRQHLDNAEREGFRSYLKMNNFTHPSTDGPLNPFAGSTPCARWSPTSRTSRSSTLHPVHARPATARPRLARRRPPRSAPVGAAAGPRYGVEVSAATVAAEAVAPTPRRMGLIWTLLMINVLGLLLNDGMILPIPKIAGQVVTMGSLAIAFGLALVLNPRIRIRPNVYLVLLSLLAILAVGSSVTLESGLGALFRCLRLTLFVITLWLLCRWWRGNLDFVTMHIRITCMVLLSVVLGLADPGAAFSGPNGRLVGAIWPIPAPQVGQYCAIVIGLSVMLWLGRRMKGRAVLTIVVPAMVILLLTHTRTALLAMGGGIWRSRV